MNEGPQSAAPLPEGALDTEAAPLGALARPVDRGLRRIPALRPQTITYLAFLIPALSFLQFQLVGRVIVVEIAMVLLLPWLWNDRDRIAVPRWLLVIWAGWAISQVVSDIVIGSAFPDLARGWAKIAFTITNLLAVAVLASTDGRARLFGIGLAVGAVAGVIFNPTEAQIADPWKYVVAGSMGFALGAVVADRRLARRAWVGIAAFAVFGVVNLALGVRSLAAIALITCVILAADAWWGSRDPGVPSGRRLIVLATVIVITMGALLVGYGAAASQGLLGANAQAKYQSQVGGAFGLLLGGRTEILGSSQAIADSPILGHGSWAKDPKYGILMNERLEALGYPVFPLAADGLIPTHSFLFGAWVEAGILGAVFWVGVAFIAIRALLRLLGRRLAIAPLVIYAGLLLLWNIPFSPYSNLERISVPFAIVLCLSVLRLPRPAPPADD